MKNLSDLAKKWCSRTLSDKGESSDAGNMSHTYVPVYSSLFDKLRDIPLNFIEVGVKSGASLAMWSEYFHPDSSIHGIDIVLNRPYQVDLRSHSNVKLHLGDATDEVFMKKFSDIDIFIDDGSHKTSDQIKTADIILPRMNKGGIYVIEDVAELAVVSRRFKGQVYDMKELRPKLNDNALFVIHI